MIGAEPPNQLGPLSRRFEVSATVRNGEVHSIRGKSLQLKPNRIVASFSFDGVVGKWRFVRVAITGTIITELRASNPPTTARSWSRQTLDDAPNWVRTFVSANDPAGVK